MPPRITKAERRLLAAYQEAALRLQRALSEAKTPAKRKRYLSEVEAILGQLDEITAGYLQDELPQQYRDGSDEAVRELRKVRGLVIDETFTQIHTEALQELVDDATLKFATALEGVRASAKSAIKKATKQEIVNKLVQAEISGESRPSIGTRKTLEEAGIVAIQSANRGWNLEDYASMLTHTILADAHNTGAMTRYLSNGIEFGEVIERGDAPDSTCRFMRGKIVWLGDRRLIPPFHPNAVFAGESFVPYGELEEIVRARYRGPARLIRLGEHELTIGPNHPMVTRRGMVPAKFLGEGDELLYDTRVKSRFAEASVGAELHDVPFVEDAFETVQAVSGHSVVTPTGHDLHGDAEFVQGEVDVVWPDGNLLAVLDSSPVEKDLKLPLAWADSELAFVAGSRSGELGGKRVLLTPSGGVSLPDAEVPWMRWLPITHICDTQYTGLAFDATTSQGLYSYGGFVVSNCFGGIKPFLGEPVLPIKSPEDPRIPGDVKKMLLKNS